ncbi:hypothetical protein [Clostridium senegalense]|nr:hypothetical protein [Clostridium senegalense]
MNKKLEYNILDFKECFLRCVLKYEFISSARASNLLVLLALVFREILLHIFNEFISIFNISS